MKIFNEEIDGAEAKRIRKKLGKTQSEMAELLGYKGRYVGHNIYRWEVGIHKIPRSTQKIYNQLDIGNNPDSISEEA